MVGSYGEIHKRIPWFYRATKLAISKKRLNLAIFYRSHNICFPTFEIGRSYCIPTPAKEGYNIVMHQEDVFTPEEHSIDAHRIHALTDQYADEETMAQLEEQVTVPAEPIAHR